MDPKSLHGSICVYFSCGFYAAAATNTKCVNHLTREVDPQSHRDVYNNAPKNTHDLFSQRAKIKEKGKYSMRDLNPRPLAHKTNALTTELNE